MVNYQEIQTVNKDGNRSNCGYSNKDTIQSKLLQDVMESMKIPMENLQKSAKKDRTIVFY